MTIVRIRLIAIAILLIPLFVVGQPKTQPGALDPFKFFVGKWEGTGKGRPGVSKVEREYEFALNGKFLQVESRSTYDPQAQNPKGEIHEEWGMISFDKNRKQFIFRQFHVEGFVIQYLSTSISADGNTIVFTSESIENIPSGWRARETYKIVNPDEFIEIFELSGSGKDFEVYSEGQFRRKK